MALTAEVDMESLVCPVCLDLPSGEVHQCFEGHCFCASCWNRFDPHRWPSCRDWLPNKNRNRDREARIAALAAACDHCGVTTTRGAMADHLRTCHLRPTTCSAGCGWKGMAAEQAAHESSCPLVFVNGLFAQQPHAVGQVRAFDGDEEGGRRRRQRVFGPAEDDAPPSDATLAVMLMSEATAALRKHLMVARVAENGCKQVRLLSEGMMADFDQLPESSVSARSLCVCGLDAVVEAMRAHSQVASVQTEGCRALRSLTKRIGPEAVTARTVEAVLDAMRAHLHATQVLGHGASALIFSTYCNDAAVERVWQRPVGCSWWLQRCGRTHRSLRCRNRASGCCTFAVVYSAVPRMGASSRKRAGKLLFPQPCSHSQTMRAILIVDAPFRCSIASPLSNESDLHKASYIQRVTRY